VNDTAGVRLREQEKTSPRIAQHRKAVKSAVGTGFACFARGFALVLAVIAGASASPRPAAAEETPAEFIRILGQDALAEMRSSASLGQKKAYFHQMLRQDFDMDGISRFVLGPYCRIASVEQLQEFRGVLEELVMRTEGAKLAQQSGGDFRVTGTRTDPDGVVVTSQVISPQGAPIEMDWQLGISDGLYKIEDFTMAGVSMALSYRSQIAQRIARDGGQVETLLAAMRTSG
jgi:phospholipid transport system substrate-binding protein